MKLQGTKICIDCEEMFRDEPRCPKCGSGAWVWLSSWIPVMKKRAAEEAPYLQSYNKKGERTL